MTTTTAGIMTKPTSTDHANLPFPKGYPIHLSPETFLETVESMMVTRAADRGILEVAIGDANVPLAGAMRRDILLPVLIDYANFVIQPQADLQFDSALNDELTSRVTEDLEASSEPHNDPTIPEKAREMTKQILGRTPLINVGDPKAGLKTRTALNKVSGIPASVTLLMLDTALESAHNLSMKHQQETSGLSEQEILDLTPVANLLASMNINEMLQSIPANVQKRLDEILGETPEQTPAPAPELNPMYDALNDDAPGYTESEPEVKA